MVKQDGLEFYEKVWGTLASQLSMAMPQTFRVGAFLEYLILRQDIAVEILQNMFADVAEDRTWNDEGLHTKNICVVDLEAQGLEDFPEWWSKMRAQLEKVGWEEAATK